MVCRTNSLRENVSLHVHHTRGFLNARNNASYAYLESIDHGYSYDPHNVHPKLQTRLYQCFDTFIRVGERMTVMKALQWSDRLRLLANLSVEEIEEMINALRILCRAFSITEEGLRREDWVEAIHVFAEAERQRRKRGEQSLMALFGDTCFDLLDEEGDGTLGFEELKIISKSLQMCRKSASMIFSVANVDVSDRIEREEIYHSLHMLWLEPYDPKYDYLCNRNK